MLFLDVFQRTKAKFTVFKLTRTYSILYYIHLYLNIYYFIMTHQLFPFLLKRYEKYQNGGITLDDRIWGKIVIFSVFILIFLYYPSYCIIFQQVIKEAWRHTILCRLPFSFHWMQLRIQKFSFLSKIVEKKNDSGRCLTSLWQISRWMQREK